MRRSNFKVFLAVLVSVVLLLAFPVTAFAASYSDVVIGNNYTLQSGQTLNNDLFVLGGTVTLMSGSTINGNVTLVGGSVQAAGTINGNFTVFGGTLNLANTFILNGNLTTAGTVVTRDPGAQIKGTENTNQNTPTIILPGGTRIPTITADVNPFFNLVGFFLGLFVWVLVAMVVAMFLPNHLNRISQAAISQPLLSGGLGVLTAIIVPIILVLLAITICLIPVSLIGAFALLAAWAFGMIALGLELGKRISTIFKREWHPALSAGLGTLVLMFILNGLAAIVPCVGWIPIVLVSFWVLGAVLLTQFGMKPYVQTPIPTGSSTQTQLPPGS